MVSTELARVQPQARVLNGTPARAACQEAGDSSTGVWADGSNNIMTAPVKRQWENQLTVLEKMPWKLSLNSASKIQEHCPCTERLATIQCELENRK